MLVMIETAHVHLFIKSISFLFICSNLALKLVLFIRAILPGMFCSTIFFPISSPVLWLSEVQQLWGLYCRIVCIMLSTFHTNPHIPEVFLRKIILFINTTTLRDLFIFFRNEYGTIEQRPVCYPVWHTKNENKTKQFNSVKSCLCVYVFVHYGCHLSETLLLFYHFLWAIVVHVDLHT